MQSYKKKIEDFTLDQLISERNRLMNDIHRFETNQLTKEEKFSAPNAWSQYQLNNMCLIQVCELINDRIDEEIHMIPLYEGRKCLLLKDGFRTLYKKFVVFPLIDQHRHYFEYYPKYNKANCVLMYGYIDENKGLRLEVITLGKVTNNGFIFYPRNLEIRNTFDISNYIDEQYYWIKDDSEVLWHRYMDELIYLDVYDVNQEVEKTRFMKFLDSSRHKEKPDHVLIHLKKDGLNLEKCWVKIVGLMGTNMVGILENEPNQNFGYHKGDEIEFVCKQINSNEYICVSEIKKNEPVLTVKDDYVLKEAIANFYKNQSQETHFEILKLLRDSYIWVPCNAVFANEDISQFEDLIDITDYSSIIGQVYKNKQPIRMVPDILQRDEDYFFPVFTSIKEMGEYGDNFSKVEKHFLEAVMLAVNNENDLRGIVVNAFSDAFILDRAFFKVLEKIPSKIEN